MAAGGSPARFHVMVLPVKVTWSLGVPVGSWLWTVGMPSSRARAMWGELAGIGFILPICVVG